MIFSLKKQDFSSTPFYCSIQDGFFQRIILISELQGKERSLLIYQLQENLVAFPGRQFEKSLFVNPFEVTLVANDLLARPVGANEDVHLLGGPDVVDEGDDTAIAPRRDGEARFFPHFAPHAVFGTLPFLELAAHANPFVVVLVVLLLGAVEHEVLAAALKVTLCGLFHTPKIRVFPSGERRKKKKFRKRSSCLGNMAIFSAETKQIGYAECCKHTRNLSEYPLNRLGAFEGTYPKIRLAG